MAAGLCRSNVVGPLQHQALDHAHTLTLDAAVDRFASISFVAATPDAQRADLLVRIRAVVVRMPPRTARVTIPYRTDLWWTQRS